MALIDLIVFTASVSVGGVIGIWIGHRFGLLGGLVGFFVGAVGCGVLVCLLFLLFDWVDGMVFSGRPRVPVCRSGKCKLAKYQFRKEQRAYLWVCECGGRYRKRGRHFYEVLPDGSSKPYMVWRPFRGWFPESSDHAAD